VKYFQYCRGTLVDHADKQHIEATESYRKAKEFAAWSRKDRLEKTQELPPLTDEQRKQMRQYLRIMQEYHALNPDSEHPDYKDSR
jgi:hypothetical protein